MPSLGTRRRRRGAPDDRVVDHRNGVILPRITVMKNAGRGQRRVVATDEISAWSRSVDEA